MSNKCFNLRFFCFLVFQWWQVFLPSYVYIRGHCGSQERLLGRMNKIEGAGLALTYRMRVFWCRYLYQSIGKSGFVLLPKSCVHQLLCGTLLPNFLPGTLILAVHVWNVRNEIAQDELLIYTTFRGEGQKKSLPKNGVFYSVYLSWRPKLGLVRLRL